MFLFSIVMGQYLSWRRNDPEALVQQAKRTDQRLGDLRNKVTRAEIEHALDCLRRAARMNNREAQDMLANGFLLDDYDERLHWQNQLSQNV